MKKRLKLRRSSWGILALGMLFSAAGWTQNASSRWVDPRVVIAHQVMLQNIGFYVDGAVTVDMEAGTVQWNQSQKEVVKRLERIVRHVGELQSIDGLTTSISFSTEVDLLVDRVSNLTYHDLRHWRMASGLTEAEQWYVMVQTALDELKMQIALELKIQLNQSLFAVLQSAMQDAPGEPSMTAAERAAWLEVDLDRPLPLVDWEQSGSTRAALSGADEAQMWGADIQGFNDSEEWGLWMERILTLLERQDLRLRALESGIGLQSVNPSTLDAQTVTSELNLPHTRLPERFDVSFYSGSFELSLTAQLQLNEVMELMGRYPHLRVVCTGLADVVGDRTSNLDLSRKRALAVRNFLLQSGVDGERVLLNYFGEERAQAAGPADRRVEIRFYVN